MQTISYSLQLHDELFEYMRKVYPHRNDSYLQWWIGNIDVAGNDCWNKCCVVKDGEIIIGCTTVNEVEIQNGEKREKYYLQANTIVSEEYRGKGLSRQIYQCYNYSNWMTLGFTDIAWKIQPKYVKNFTPIKPVRIYITFNFKVLGQLFNRLFKSNKKDDKSFFMPEQIKAKNNELFVKVSDVGQIDVPKSGRWIGDKVELVRDSDYLNKRFFNIYCANRYGVYRYEKDGKLEGYIVLRKMHYASLDLVSVVDYRFMDCHDERRAFVAANKLAKKNNIGFVFGMSSRKYGVLGTPILFRARKLLNCAVGTKEIDFSDMLVTSADSDLDFVYY